MNNIFLRLTMADLKRIKDFILQDEQERVVFLSVVPADEDDGLSFYIKDIYFVPDNELNNSNYSVKLNYEAQAKIIKWAWDNNASLAEIHSHPFCKRGASFSYSDIYGLKEFVTHVWWRLKNKPYIAFVFGKKDYDALAWIDNPHHPQYFKGILTGKKFIKPTNNTIINWEEEG